MSTRAARPWLLIAAAVLTVVATLAPPAHAEEPGYGWTPDDRDRIGLDVSWPQCDRPLPEATSYAIIGVNGGTAANTNPCLAAQLRWASAATTDEPRVQLYVNTANPGEVLTEFAVTTWPTDDVDPRGASSSGHSDQAQRNPYGRCTTRTSGSPGYVNDLACSWQYGWNRAVESVDDRLVPAARSAGVSDVVSDYIWWLDVETMNTWQRDVTDGRARNAATLEGMAQFFATEGASDVGIYSTHYQWHRIVGDAVGSTGPAGHVIAGNLIGAPAWVAGASNQASALRRCGTLTGFTGGTVVMNQYIADGLDHNQRCP